MRGAVEKFHPGDDLFRLDEAAFDVSRGIACEAIKCIEQRM